MRLSRVARPQIGVDELKLTQVRQVAALFIAALFARLWIFWDVAVNGDTGLYLYDAKQLLWGRQIFVDFPSRSPLMEYLLAGVVGLSESPLVGARSFMVVIGLLLGLAVYAFGRQLHSHGAGLVGAAIFWLSPFSLVWGLWVKTEPVVELVMLATFGVVIYGLRRDRVPLWAGLATGALFGVAFHIRRVVVVHAAAVAVFAVYYRWRTGRLDRSLLRAGGGTLAGGVGVLAVIYLTLARFNPGLAWRLVDVHALALILSNGQGSLGWVGLADPTPITSAGEVPWWRHLCQKCGVNTIKTFLRTVLVTLPIVLILLVFLRSYLDSHSRALWQYTAGIYGLLGVYALWKLRTGMYPVRALGIVTVLAGLVAVSYFDVPEFDDFWEYEYGLVVATLALLVIGYLYRDRILYPTYFQDFYPLLSVLCGIVVVELYRRNRLKRKQLLAAGATLLLVATLVAGANAYPYQPNGVDDDSLWFTIDSVQEYGDDIDARTDPGDRVYAAQPLYVIESERRLAADLSRKYYAFRGWPRSQQREEAERQLTAAIAENRTTHAVVDTEAEMIRSQSGDEFNETFDRNFCPVEGDAIYEQTNAQLYRRCSA